MKTPIHHGSPLLSLPNELILAVAQFLSTERDIAALARASQRAYNLLTTFLYTHNAVHSRFSALRWAADSGSDGTFRYASAVGVDIHAVPSLQIAAEKGHEEVVKLLLGNTDQGVFRRHKNGYKALTAASSRGHLGVARMLLEHGDYMSDPVGTDCSAIHVAAYSGQANMIELLLDHGAHVDGTCIPHHQVTPLGEAACCGREAAVVVLLDHGSNIDAACDDGTTILSTVVCNGLYGIAEILLKRGASPYIASNNNWTPMLLAATSGAAPNVRLLLQYGATVEETTSDGRGSLYLASEQGYLDVVGHIACAWG